MMSERSLGKGRCLIGLMILILSQDLLLTSSEIALTTVFSQFPRLQNDGIRPDDL